MLEVYPYLAAGITLGVSAGVAPGPLTALLVSETVQRGRGAGLRVAIAPVLTDVPIVALALLVMARLAQADPVLGVISLLGAGFVAWLGWESWCAAPPDREASEKTAHSLRKGIVTNVLNPHPYLFWFTVGAPMTVRAAEGPGMSAAIGFVALFYAGIVGTKVAMALLTDRARGILAGKGYRAVNQSLGALLWVFAIVLVRDGVRFLAGTAG